MRLRTIGLCLLFAALFAADGVTHAQAPAVAGAFVRTPLTRVQRRSRPHLMPALAEAFKIDGAAVRDAAFVRCVGPKLMGLLCRRQPRLRQG